MANVITTHKFKRYNNSLSYRYCCYCCCHCIPNCPNSRCSHNYFRQCYKGLHHPESVTVVDFSHLLDVALDVSEKKDTEYRQSIISFKQSKSKLVLLIRKIWTFLCLNVLIYNLFIQFIEKKNLSFSGLKTVWIKKKKVSNSFEHLAVFFSFLNCIVFSMVNESNCTCWCIQSNSSEKSRYKHTHTLWP